MPKKRTAATGEGITVCLAFGSEEREAKGTTVVDALEALDLASKGKGTLTVRNGTLSASLVVYPLFVKRLAVNKVARQLFEKRIATMLR